MQVHSLVASYKSSTLENVFCLKKSVVRSRMHSARWSAGCFENSDRRAEYARADDIVFGGAVQKMFVLVVFTIRGEKILKKEESGKSGSQIVSHGVESLVW